MSRLQPMVWRRILETFRSDLEADAMRKKAIPEYRRQIHKSGDRAFVVLEYDSRE